ncbi:MAG: chorismate-binding protein [Nitrospira sp.]
MQPATFIRPTFLDRFTLDLDATWSASDRNRYAGDLYRRLRRVNPSPFAGLVRFPEVTLVSSSPERLVRLSGSQASTRPIAGTRPRGNGQSQDVTLRAELLASPKERAEHVMLVDLERNDLGKVCRYGSVRVDEFMTIEQYSHVSRSGLGGGRHSSTGHLAVRPHQGCVSGRHDHRRAETPAAWRSSKNWIPVRQRPLHGSARAISVGVGMWI